MPSLGWGVGGTTNEAKELRGDGELQSLGAIGPGYLPA